MRPGFRGRTLAALGAVVVVLVTVPPPVAAHHYAPIQPGAELGNGCTMNFVFEDADGGLYVGTAGHCKEVGEEARTARGEVFGTTVLSVHAHEPVHLDFGLIRIDPTWHDAVDPAVRYWGGPTGMAPPREANRILLYGSGTGFDAVEATRPRTGIVTEADGGIFGVRVEAAPTAGGDSGSPVLGPDGRATGAIFGAGAGAEDGTLAATAAVSLPAVLDHLSEEGFDVEIVTAPFRGDPVERRTVQADHCRATPTGAAGCVRTDCRFEVGETTGLWCDTYGAGSPLCLSAHVHGLLGVHVGGCGPH